MAGDKPLYLLLVEFKKLSGLGKFRAEAELQLKEQPKTNLNNPKGSS
ncbi:MAG: hypothetical protein F7C07_08745 [Desulfurococcales archaeon]|nr:hypothetical protein [Desulfurococcales archaeon]